MLSLRISHFSSYSKTQPLFINFIPLLMANPSHPFVSVLMTLVFKRKSLRNPNTNIFSLSNANTLFVFLSSPFSPSQTLLTVYSDQPLHHDTGKRSKFFLP